MRVALPHQLGKDEVRSRLKRRSHEIGESFPGGMAEVTTAWPNEDRMTMAISAMGQQLQGAVEIGDGEVVIELDLPPALSFIKPIVEGAIRKQGQKLLIAPKG